jgi:hypothetical protein
LRRRRRIVDAATCSTSRMWRSQAVTARGSQGRFFNIDLINELEAESHAARPHRQLAKPAI